MRFALKGHLILAQGKTLGNEGFSPEGASHDALFQGADGRNSSPQGFTLG